MRKPRKSKAAKEAEAQGGQQNPTPGGSNNPYADPFAEELIVRHEEFDKDIAAIMSRAMLDCKEIRQEQRELLDAAKERGMNKRALRAHLKERALLRKAEEVRDKETPEVQDELDLLRHALGVLGDTPLGQAAVARAGGNLAGAEAQGSA